LSNRPSHLLIVDDDRGFAESAGMLAKQEGFEVEQAGTLGEAHRLLRERRFDLLALDLHLPDGSGLDLLDDIDLASHGRIIIVTGNPSIESAMHAVSQPVVDYLVKPLQTARWLELLHSTQRTQMVANDTQLMRTGLIGRSEAIRRIVATLLRVAPTDAAVLITGESGTGKELAAQTLHEASGRKGAFVALNCGAVPSELLASQLFGHERGSFTGASARHIGVFEQAAHGTLFLDEITEMPQHLQVYLLRALETGTITRVGGDESIPTPTRVISATNRDPLAAIAEGRLREDLYYRLADIAVHMPPLRERDEDAILLARVFIDRLNARYGQRKRLAHSSERILLRHLWPGNVRELRSAVQRAYLLDSSDAIVVNPVAAQPSVLDETETSVVFSVGMTMAEVERRMLLKTLAHYGNDKTAAARALGISVRTVHNHLARIAQERDGAAAA
jgi:DNA-binding NtrC family response regulator